MATPVPVENIYYLLAYAWNRLPEAGLIKVSDLGSTELADLFAHVLSSGVKRLLRQGLDQQYVERVDEIPGIRGRIAFAESIRTLSFSQGRAVCRFDELTVDTAENQVLRATLKNLSRVESVSPKLRESCRSLSRSMAGVSDITISRRSFRRLQARSGARMYAFLIDVCRIVTDSILPSEAPGNLRFRDFSRDHAHMARLFESFIARFIAIECPDLNVRKEKIGWTLDAATDFDRKFLPTMETDVSVRSEDHLVVIEAKYYGETLAEHYGTKKVNSQHLYQLFAYLENLTLKEDSELSLSGMILYPTVEDHVHLDYVLKGHPVAIRTVDLSRPWQAVRSQMLAIVAEAF